jgi:chromosome segregation ATPase
VETTETVAPAEVAALSAGLAALTETVDTLAAREIPTVDLNPLRREIGQLAGRLEAVEAREAAAPSEVAALRKSLGEATARMEDLEKRDVPPPVAFVLLQQEVKTLAQRLTAVERREIPEPPAPVDLRPVRAAIAALATRVALLEKRPETPPVDLKALTGQVERLAALVAALEKRRTEPLAQADRWSLGQDINKLAYRLEALEDSRKAEANSIASLRREIRMLEKRLDTLAKRVPPEGQ